MEFASAVVGALTDTLVKSACYPIGRHFRYMYNHLKKIEKLKIDVSMLEDKLQLLKGHIDAAERINAAEIAGGAHEWMHNANTEIQEAKNFLQVVEGTNSRCLMRLCPDLRSHYKTGKMADEKSNCIAKLIEKCPKENELCFPPTGIIVHQPFKNFEDFPSRMSIMNEIMETLKDDGINIFGIYGMSGVGKSALVKQIAAQANEENKLFDDIVIADVSHKPDLKEIQGKIARTLDLKFDGVTLAERATHLEKRLKNTKRLLVILDDIWDTIDLKEIGIPHEEHKGCKVLVTSRNQEVLSLHMGTQKEFMIDVLKPDESWSFFQKMTGSNAMRDPNVASIAEKVAKGCGNLPVLILTVAKTLKDKSLHTWKEALKQLQWSSNRGMRAKIDSSLELSYSYLDDELKSFFLLCGIQGGEPLITDFLKYSTGLGLFKQINTVEEARNRLHVLVENLKAFCWLLDGEKNITVKMHDVIRHFAIRTAAKDPNFMFAPASDATFREWPTKDIVEKCTTISVHGNYIHALPERLGCPDLELFHITLSVETALEIPDTFFEVTTKLKVVDLTDFSLPRLPSSLLSLENIQTLCLDQCKLGDISEIGNMDNLRVLSLRGSDIEELPKELGKLSRLRLLDLSNSSKLKVILPGILSNLTRLEELYLKKSFTQWAIEETESQTSNASLAELKQLPYLANLQIQIPDAKMMPKD